MSTFWIVYVITAIIILSLLIKDVRESKEELATDVIFLGFLFTIIPVINVLFLGFVAFKWVIDYARSVD